MVDSAMDASANFDALASTASDLLGGLQQSLGQGTSRGPSPAPKEKEKERQKEEKRHRRPQTLSRVFVIDVSAPSAQKGVVRAVCESLRKGLYGDRKDKANDDAGSDANEGEEEEDVIGKGERIAIVTVSESVGFWNLSVCCCFLRRSHC
jgi:protein transport protein SEC24